MSINNYFKIFPIPALLLFLSIGFCAAQTNKMPAPRQEKLLNGLKLLTFNDPNAEKVTLKLRIHSGSAFDPQRKEGTMALLGNILFPDAAARDFFREDLKGSLDVDSNYDYIQITATAVPDQYLAMLETVANAVAKLQIDKNNTAKVVSAQLEKVKELEKSPPYIADRAAAERLYGSYPYGRAQMGTGESLSKIEYADLIFARDKFLTPDSATLAFAGNIKPELISRAVRRYFGSWEKSDKKVPATFAQPETPDTKPLTIEMPNAENGLNRTAMITVGRNDKDFYATEILVTFWRNQLCLNDESKRGKLSFEPHLLQGTYLISQIIQNPSTLPFNPSTLIRSGPCSFLLVGENGKPVFPSVAQSDFEQAKNKVIADLNQKTSSINGLADLWLDVDTYKLTSVKDELQKADNVKLEDVQRVAENLQKQPIVSVTVKKTAETQK